MDGFPAEAKTTVFRETVKTFLYSTLLNKKKKKYSTLAVHVEICENTTTMTVRSDGIAITIVDPFELSLIAFCSHEKIIPFSDSTVYAHGDATRYNR